MARRVKVSIIVLVKDRWADTRRCLRSLERSTPPGLYELLVYDNASSPRAAARLRRFAATRPRLRLERNEENLSFARAVNRGMRAATGEFIVWLNNDTVLAPGWLEGLLAAAAPAGVAAAGPMTGSMAPPEQISGPFRTRPRALAREAPFLGGFCLLLRRRWARRAGLLDERFRWGWEDMDYCLRLRHAGGRLALARNVYVRHVGNRTIETLGRPERRRDDLANRRLIVAKWMGHEVFGADLRRLFLHLLAPWGRRPPEASLIVPFRGDWRAYERCLAALKRSATRTGYEVLALLDCAGGEAARRLARLSADWPELAVTRCARGGRAEAVNEALRSARGEHRVLLEPEAVVSPGWLDGLLAAARSAPGVGLVGPCSNGRSLGAQAVARRPKRRERPWRRKDGRWRKAGLKTVDFLRSFCVMVSRKTVERLGLLDTRLGRDGAVSDYCLRARQAGLGVVVARETFVYRDPAADRPPWSRILERRDGARGLLEKWAGHHLLTPSRSW